MKKLISVLFCLCLVGEISHAQEKFSKKVDFSKPAPAKTFQYEASSFKTRASNGSGPSPKITNSAQTAPVNIIPIISLNSKVKNAVGIEQHIPCSATRLTSTLVLTAAHCVAPYFEHNSRIHADVFEADDGTQGLIFSKPASASSVKPNATIAFYRPNYQATEGSREGIAFDFAVVKLDPVLKFNPEAAQAQTQATLEKAQSVFQGGPLQEQGSFPSELVSQQISVSTTQSAQTAFKNKTDVYRSFMNKSLKKVDLLQMNPDVVAEEMQNRAVRAYYWGASADSEFQPKRDALTVFKGSTIGPDFNNNNSHALIFALPIVSGTSGSPIFDAQRNLVVSVASVGDDQNGRTQGGLIDEKVCQWVKSYDSNVKCLVVLCDNCPAYGETEGTAAWGK